MVTYFDREKLQRFTESFYDITGITISIYDKNLNQLCAHKGSMCDFCTMVRSDSELLKNCLLSDEKALRRCQRSKECYTYKCHMGLIEVATPIIYKDEILGYILFGQITLSDDKTAITEKINAVRQYFSVSEAFLEKAVGDIRVCTEGYVSSVSHIVKMAAEYIVLNKILSYSDEVEKQIELYIRTNIGKKLTVNDICRQFNISVTTLYNLSVKYFGCSIGQYIAGCRIELAQEMLSDGKRLSVIAEAIGFSDMNYFVRFFKNAVGITPKQYQLRSFERKKK